MNLVSKLVIGAAVISLIIVLSPTGVRWWYVPWLLGLSCLPQFKPNAFTVTIAFVVLCLELATWGKLFCTTTAQRPLLLGTVLAALSVALGFRRAMVERRTPKAP